MHNALFEKEKPDTTNVIFLLLKISQELYGTHIWKCYKHSSEIRGLGLMKFAIFLE